MTSKCIFTYTLKKIFNQSLNVERLLFQTNLWTYSDVPTCATKILEELILMSNTFKLQDFLVVVKLLHLKKDLFLRRKKKQNTKNELK